MARKKRNTKKSFQRQAWGVVILGVSLLLCLSIISFNVNDPVNLDMAENQINVHNWLGPVGSSVSYFLMQWTFGYPIIILPVLLFFLSLVMIRGEAWTNLKRTSWLLIFWAFLISIFLAMPEALDRQGHITEYYPSGLIGGWLAGKLVVYLGNFGSLASLIVISIALLVISVRLEINRIFDYSARLYYGILHFLKTGGSAVRNRLRARLEKHHEKKILRKQQQEQKRASREIEEPVSSPPETPDPLPEISIDEHPQKSEEFEKPPAIPAGEDKSELSESGSMIQTDLDEILASLDKIKKQEPESGQPLEPDTPSEGLDFEVQEETSETELDYDQQVKESIARYKFPTIDLLKSAPAEDSSITRAELKANAELLEMKLLDFGVKAKVIRVKAGPVITLYELQPAPGVKVNSIVNLANDLALAMEARGIRIIAPIPGKAAVGIEIPNRNPQIVYLKSLIQSEKFISSEYDLPLAIGKTISGESFIADLTKMPHLLIAGATGSGKSVGINTLIMSMIYAINPGMVKFMLIDPKKLELSLYRDLRDHYLLWRPDLDEEVITKASNAVSMLNSIVLEMERRYDQLSKIGVRNIREYNAKVAQNHERVRNLKVQQLPYIVVIVDELADLMMVAAKEVETPVARLAQMARAVGIHLILATQRPSVDVITGVIKANFPVRIAYQVASKVDSRTVLDVNGAEQLLGNGDMLILLPGRPKPIRLQNPFVSTEEVEAVINHIRRQPKLPLYSLPQPGKGSVLSAGGGTAAGADPLYEDAKHVVVQAQKGSISYLQRRLGIGYSRAAKLMDELEENGIVGPPDGSKPREVLITLQEL